MPENVGQVETTEGTVDIVLSNHALIRLNDPRTPERVADRTVIAQKMTEGISDIVGIYHRTESAFTVIIQSPSTKLSLTCAFRRLRSRSFELKLISYWVGSNFEPRDRKDYIVKVSKRTVLIGGLRAFEIGRGIYATATSFENGDPYGFIQRHLVEDIEARRGEFAPGFNGTFDTRDKSIFCVASVDRSGNYLIDSALWLPPVDTHTVHVR
jgi:hypothetical protein